ncbi:cytidylate kinase [Hydrogenoanaerobacterium saccharovorans]|uniref:Cytidylate kinase n=1 Tax=Hydrogenoanaerobacterium saccharovorans TaxID=474960 RepID=A0A1H7YNR7_9FIRM|nr:cytidylate kinase-like family protein [Hydrogenoanaerobacterium saccharovorans]RPF49099.1 cytidylate kinase [Hydrogenoanaerobacterium saccharovorans]SEM47886.1 Cytidylate kinase [Hydrogenoanaerobacterium saccharovorans]
MKRNTIITISRQFGSGGRTIGKMLAERLNIPFYDKELISLAAKESGFDEDVFKNADESASSSLLYSLSLGMYSSAAGRADGLSGMTLNDRIYVFQSKVIRDIAAKGSCVIVGRCADYILADNPDAIHVFVHSDMRSRLKRVIERYNIPAEKAEQLVLKTDKRRATYHDYYASYKWGRAENYHLALNSDFIGLDNAAEVIAAFAEHRASKDS